MNTTVLDTSAILALRYREPGMETVKDVLRSAQKKQSAVYASTLSQLEIFHLTCRHDGKQQALRTHLELKMLPIEFIPPTEDILLLAGEFKAECAFSLADAIIAATAFRKNSTLVHKDPEYEALKQKIKMKALPYKG